MKTSTMMKRILFGVVILLAMSLPQSGHSESSSVLIAAGDSDRIILRWVWPEGSYYAPRYKIYRKTEGTKKWDLLTPEPVTKIRDRDKAREVLGDEMYKKYETILFPKLPDRKKEPAKYREAILHIKELWGMTMLSADLYPALADLLGVRYEDGRVEKGTRYVYRLVIAGDEKEENVGISRPVSADKPFIAPPQGVQGKATDGVVLLRWKNESRFSAYDVYRSNKKEGTYDKVNTHPVVILKTYDSKGKVRYPEWFYVDRDLKNGKTYWYTVWGRDPFGRFSRIPRPISLVPRDMTPPAPPAKFTTEVKRDDVTLTWERPPDKDCAGYTIYRSLDFREGFKKIVKKPLRPGTLKYVDKGLKPETMYWYYATAVDESGNESGRSYTAPANVRDWLPPESPTGLTGKTEPGKVLLAWKSNAEEDLVGYRVYQAMKKDAEYYHLIERDPVAETSFVSALPETASTNPYYYKVTAVDRTGNESDASNIVEVKLPDVTPPFPPVFDKVKAEEGIIILMWHESRERDCAGYNLYRKEKQAADDTRIALNKELLSSKVLEYKDTFNLVPGMRYSYTLKAVDRDGNISKPSRPIIAATFDKTPPNPPKGLKAKALKDGTGIQLSWKLPKADDLQGVILYRSKKEKGTYYPMTDIIVDTDYLDRDVKKGKKYFYRLSAFDQHRNKSEYSRIVTAEIPVEEPKK